MVSITHAPRGNAAMMPPPTPVSVTSHRPSYGFKRDSSYLDTDDEADLSITTKKLKVAFDPRVDIRIMDHTWGNKSLDLIREEVKVGIERHFIHDEEQYTKLIRLLRQDPGSSDAISTQTLLKYIMALDARVSQLGECGQLTIASLDVQWLGRNEGFFIAFVKYLVALTTTHAKYLQAVMDRMVTFFARLPASCGRMFGESTITRAEMFGRVHTIIKTLVRQIPAASNCLIKSLRLEYPNDLSTSRSYEQYQKHMLRICEYAQEIKAEITAMIVQRLVALDMQIQLDIEDLEEEAEERILQRSGHAQDLESDESDAESVSSSEETNTDEEEQLKDLKLKVAKMDGTMDLLFTHYDPLVRNGELPDHNEAFLQLINHFITFILPNRTRHAQFLLFHFSQVTSEHIDMFAAECLKLAAYGSNALVRPSALAYLSSFIARGAHIPRDSVQIVFDMLLVHVEEMRRRYEPTCRGPDRKAYTHYYAAVQAILYIFCFRWRDLVVHDEAGDNENQADDILAEDGDLTWLPTMKDIFHKSIFSTMNPLKVCSPAIVSEFANIARHVRFIEILSKVESNRRLRLGQTASYYGLPGGIDVGRRETAWDRKAGDAHHQLEAYFPFDPYHLPNSKRWVDGDYNGWKAPRGMNHDDDDADDDGYYDEEDSDDDAESVDSVVEGMKNDISLEVLSNSS